MNTTFLRSLSGAALSCLAAALLVTGCSDATGPLPPDNNPIGYNATTNVSDPVPADEAADVRTNVQKHANDTVEVSPNEAAETARSQYPNGEVLAVNLDFDRDTLNYECVVRSNGKTYVVVVSSKDGRVIEKREITNYYYDTVVVIRQTVVRIHEVRTYVIKIVEGDVVEMNLEEVEGRPTYVVVILTRENRYVTIYIDGETGKERKLKDDGKCKEEKHKNKRGRGHYRHGKGKGYGHHYHCHCDCTDDKGDVIPQGVISVDSARTITGTIIDSATIRQIAIRIQDSTHVYYDVKASRDSNEYEITLDAFTGSLVSAKQTKGNMDSVEFRPNVTGDSLVALSVARTAALAAQAGTITSWKLENDATEAKWVYTFEIQLTGTNDKKKVLIDAKTGLLIRIE